MQDKKVDAGPLPEDLSKKNLLSLVTPVIFDSAGWFWNFGDVTQQPPDTAKIGDTVSVKFVSDFFSRKFQKVKMGLVRLQDIREMT